MLIHPRDLFPASMMPAASKLPRPAVLELEQGLVLVLVQALVPGQVLVPEQELELELVQVLVQVLVPGLHNQPPPNRSP